MDQIEIIHISAVVFDAQFPFDQLVHAVQVQQRKALVDLIAQRNAFALGAVNKQVAQPAYIRVMAEVVAYDILQLIVGNVIEELGKKSYFVRIVNPVN